MSETTPNILGGQAQPAITRPRPSIGRIVIHRGIESNGSKDHPAIVNAVWSTDCVNLTVFPDCGSPQSRSSQMIIDPTNREATGWFWPPRVP